MSAPSHPATYYLNEAINWGAHLCDASWKKVGNSLYPAVLGAIGGRFAGDWRFGVIQGLTSGVLHTFILIPTKYYVSKEKGEEKGKLDATTVKWLKVAGIVADWAIPFAFTWLFGKKILDGAAKILPQRLQVFVQPNPNFKYSLPMAFAIDILPVGVQQIVEHFWGKDPRHKA